MLTPSVQTGFSSTNHFLSSVTPPQSVAGLASQPCWPSRNCLQTSPLARAGLHALSQGTATSFEQAEAVHTCFVNSCYPSPRTPSHLPRMEQVKGRHLAKQGPQCHCHRQGITSRAVGRQLSPSPSNPQLPGK